MNVLQSLRRQFSLTPSAGSYHALRIPLQPSIPRPRRNLRVCHTHPTYFLLAFVGCLLFAIYFIYPRPRQVRPINDKYDKVFVTGCASPEVESLQPRANAALVILARNQDLDGVVKSVKSMERHFNRWFHYPYIFLNDQEFDATFQDTIKRYTSSNCQFGKIDPDHWGFPDWMDADLARERIELQGKAGIMYGGLESYHHMCRFFSGFFYKHELLQTYDWYWRVEPDIEYFCDITYDPFLLMERQNKTYGFTIAAKEIKETVPSLFHHTTRYKSRKNLTGQGLWEMFVEPVEEQQQVDYLFPHNETYNLCHFWSNFEIARLDWFRSREYQVFFEYMDHTGGFWLERWGDAPFHSLAAGMLLSPYQIHYFRDFGYRHTTMQHCPANAPELQLPRSPYLELTTPESSRQREDGYWDDWDSERENGVGCRCRCGKDASEVEDADWTCMPRWIEFMGGFVDPEKPV